MRLLPRVQAGLDWWLAPRWRALLTWAILSVLAWFVLLDRGWGLRLRLLPIDVVVYFREAHAVYLPYWLTRHWDDMFTAMLSTAFRPVILRLGLWRTIAWIAMWMLLFAAAEDFFGSIRVYRNGEWMFELSTLIVCGIVTVLPALLVIGRRTPVPMILGALAVYTICLIAFQTIFFGWETSPGSVRAVILRGFVLPDIIFGAVLIYGTKPLPPRGRAQADGRDAHATAPAPAP